MTSRLTPATSCKPGCAELFSNSAALIYECKPVAQTAALAICGFFSYGLLPGVAATLRRQCGGLNPALQKPPRASEPEHRASLDDHSGIRVFEDMEIADISGLLART